MALKYKVTVITVFCAELSAYQYVGDMFKVDKLGPAVLFCLQITQNLSCSDTVFSEGA